MEALVSSVPLICIPVWADQPGVASRVVAAGAGLKFQNGHVDEDSFADAVAQILTNVSYKANASRLSKLLKFGGGAQRAAEHILLFLETGARGEHLVNYFTMAPVWRYYVTLSLALAVPLVVLAALCFCICRCCCCCCCCRRRASKAQTVLSAPFLGLAALCYCMCVFCCWERQGNAKKKRD